MKEPCANRLFDVAMSGAVGNDMPGQVAGLIDLLKADPNVDFANDWKVITMWIGANDLCRYACRMSSQRGMCLNLFCFCSS
jgi:phospholipase B1